MRLWILIGPPTVSEDTAYLVGRVTSRFGDVTVTQVSATDSKPPPVPDGVAAILNRSFNGSRAFLTELDKVAATAGAAVVNPGAATFRACDKRSYIQDYAGLIPRTWTSGSIDEIADLHSQVGDDVVLKNPFGKHGKDMIRFSSEKDIEAAASLIELSGGSGLVVQQFCSGFLSGDKRVIVHRGLRGRFEIAAWFKRVPKPGEWKSNVSAGGSVVSCELEQDERDLAIEVAEIAGLDYVGIDLARHDGRCLLIETNAYTGGHINFDTERQTHSGDDFARMVLRIARDGRP